MAGLPLLIALAAVPAAGPPVDRRIDPVVEAALTAWEVPGAAVVVVAPDRVIHLKGYGVRRLGQKDPVTPDTVFPLASCTKAFTTALAARLADEGKLAWDDPVRKHLPDFHLSDPDADRLVTLRDLAAHRTGLAGHDLLWYRSQLSQDELVRRAAKLPLARPFRTEMQYQTIMYVALGQAAARAGGKAWDELLTDRLLKPLGMTGATLTTTAAAKASDRAAGNRPGPDGKLAEVRWYEQPAPNPAGSVNATARDLAAWLRFHLADGKHGDDQLVSAAGLRETRTPQTVIRAEGGADALNPDANVLSYGLGWVVQDYRGHLLCQHTGLIDGFRAHLTLLPKDGYALAVLANREGTRMNLALSNTLVDLLLGLPAKDWNKYLRGVLADEAAARRVQARKEDLGRRPDTAPAVPLADLAGVYEDAAYGRATVRAGKDGLEWDWKPWTGRLEHYAFDTFRLRAGDERLDGQFVRFQVADEKVISFRLFGVNFKRK